MKAVCSSAASPSPPPPPAAAGRRGRNRGRRNAEGLLERLDPLGKLEHRDALQLVNPFLCAGCHVTAPFSSPDGRAPAPIRQSRSQFQSRARVGLGSASTSVSVVSAAAASGSATAGSSALATGSSSSASAGASLLRRRRSRVGGSRLGSLRSAEPPRSAAAAESATSRLGSLRRRSLLVNRPLRLQRLRGGGLATQTRPRQSQTQAIRRKPDRPASVASTPPSPTASPPISAFSVRASPAIGLAISPTSWP